MGDRIARSIPEVSRESVCCMNCQTNAFPVRPFSLRLLGDFSTQLYERYRALTITNRSKGVRVGLLSVCLSVANALADEATESSSMDPSHSFSHSAMNADVAALDLALWSAAADGDTELFDRLLMLGAQAQGPDMPTTALWIAAQEGATEIVVRLLALGVDVEAKDPVDGRTALFQAAQEGHAAIVNRLLDAGARVDVASTRTGATPLFMAAARGHAEVVRLLLDARADINVSASADGGVDSPVSIARRRGFPDIVDMIERSDDPDPMH